jgi:hypothetical protein
MTKKKPTRRVRKRTTLADELRPILRSGRKAAMPFNESMLIDGGRISRIRKQRARLARRVLKRVAERDFGANFGDFVTRTELRQLCGAAMSHEAEGASGKTSEHVASAAGRLLALSKTGDFYWSKKSDAIMKLIKKVTEDVEAVLGSALVQKAGRK